MQSPFYKEGVLRPFAGYCLIAGILLSYIIIRLWLKKIPLRKLPTLKQKDLLFLLLSFFSLLCLFSYDIDDMLDQLDGHDRPWLCVGLDVSLWSNQLTSVLVFIGWTGWKLLLQGEIPGSRSKIFYLSLLGISVSFLLNLAAEKGLPVPGP